MHVMNLLFGSKVPGQPRRQACIAVALGSILLMAANSAIAQTQPMVKDTIAQRSLACAACHGENGRATREGFFPRIAGKPAGYLYNQLVNFQAGRRQYPMMTYMVAHLSDDYLHEMAQHFADQHPPYPAPAPFNASAEVLERGRRLVAVGDPARRIPACVACHGQNLAGVSSAIPGLLGLPRDYLNLQFGNWKNGTRKAAAPDCMAHISERLSPEDISAVTTWIAAQGVPDKLMPAAASSMKLPLPCGSVPQ